MNISESVIASESEAIQREGIGGYSVEELRALVQEGLDSGEFIDGREAFARIKKKLLNKS